MRKIIVVLLAASIFTLVGCSGLMDSVKEKSINLQTEVYGMRVTACDPSTGAATPSGELGFGSIDYHSAPMGKGQPYYAKRTTNSIWSERPASETTIWIGRSSEPCVLQFEAVPGDMIKIAGDGTVKSGSATVTITPTEKK